MINIARLTKRVAPVSGGILVSLQFASTAVVGVAQTINARARPHNCLCISAKFRRNE
jgi:hypothetical protein